MIGANYLDINEATMMKILQLWITDQFEDPVKVTGVVKTQSHFRVSLQEDTDE